jgi:hypothetical protein
MQKIPCSDPFRIPSHFSFAEKFYVLMFMQLVYCNRHHETLVLWNGIYALYDNLNHPDPAEAASQLLKPHLSVGSSRSA